MTATAAPVRERPILFSGPMVRAILDGTKTQTRRVVTLPKRATFKNASASTWDDRAAAFRALDPKVSESTIGLILGARRSGQELLCNLVDDVGVHVARCPYGEPGDRLWVRETWNAQLEWPEGPGDFRMRWWQDVPRGFRGPKNCVRLHYAADNAEWELLCDDDGNDVMISPAGQPALANKWRPSIHMPRWASRLSLELTGVRVERVQDISEADVQVEGCTGSPLGTGGDAILYPTLWDSLNAKRGYGWDVNPWVWVLEFARVTP